MDISGFAGFVEGAVATIAAASDYAKDMDGRAAFVLGMLTWFGIEQAVRRLAGLLRWAILAAAIGGTGFAGVALLADDEAPPPAAEAAATPS
ncbi:MAG TPA: hypothetical protein VEH84_02230 [Alphaproteobacteria bacterium]|nr:hypothetical protein [Alphaproteobacteria bacterium]